MGAAHADGYSALGVATGLLFGIYLRERLLAMSTEPFGTKVLFANFYRAVVELAYREADVLTPV